MTLVRLAYTMRPLAIDAQADPPRDRTTRAAKAVELCKDEWTRAYKLAKEKGQSEARAVRMASVAYKLAMPRMDTLPTIRAAITCIAHGITLEVFDGNRIDTAEWLIEQDKLRVGDQGAGDL